MDTYKTTAVERFDVAYIRCVYGGLYGRPTSPLLRGGKASSSFTNIAKLMSVNEPKVKIIKYYIPLKLLNVSELTEYLLSIMKMDKIANKVRNTSLMKLNTRKIQSKS